MSKQNSAHIRSAVTTNERLAYGLSELAEATSLSVDFLRKEIRAGRLRARKVGARRVVRIEDAREWLSNCPDARSGSADPGPDGTGAQAQLTSERGA